MSKDQQSVNSFIPGDYVVYPSHGVGKIIGTEKRIVEGVDLELLIVCDKYLTGFDSPITYIMYVDKPLKDYNLVQAISRTSTVYKEKPNGIIIDYRNL